MKRTQTDPIRNKAFSYSEEHTEAGGFVLSKTDPTRSLSNNQRSTAEVFNFLNSSMESEKPMKVVTSHRDSNSIVKSSFPSCPEEFRTIAEAGTMFMKHSGARIHDPPENKTVRIIFEESTDQPICIAWGSGSTMSMSEIRVVVLGLFSPTFVKKSHRLNHNRCFSIIAKHRILDFEHENEQLVAQWVHGLRFLIGQTKEEAEKMATQIRDHPPQKILFSPSAGATPPSHTRISDAVTLTRNQSWQSARRRRDRRQTDDAAVPSRNRRQNEDPELPDADDDLVPVRQDSSFSEELSVRKIRSSQSVPQLENKLINMTKSITPSGSDVIILCEDLDDSNSDSDEAVHRNPSGSTSDQDESMLLTGSHSSTLHLLSEGHRSRPNSTTLSLKRDVSEEALKRSISTFNVAENLSFIQSAQLTTLKKSDKTPLNELIITEDTYIEALRGIFKKFLVPLRKINSHKKLYQKLESCLAPSKILLHFHEKFICDLLDLIIKYEQDVYITNPELVAQVFTKRKKEFFAYKLYINRYGDIQSALKELETADSDVFEWLGKQPSFEQYLLHPIQRIPRYVLLVKEMIKASGADETSPLQSALDFLKKITDHLNAGKKKMESFNRLSELMEHMIALPEMFWRTEEFGINERILIFEDVSKRKKNSGLMSRISRKSSTNQRFFLFDDCIVLTDYHYRAIRVEYFYFVIDVWRDGLKVCVICKDKEKKLILTADTETKADEWFNRIANLYERAWNERIVRKGGFVADILGMSINALMENESEVPPLS